MRSFFATVFAIGAVASPLVAQRDCYGSCITDEQAKQVATNFQTLITSYSNATTDQVLSPDFMDYSDSVAELINSQCPATPAVLGSPTFSSRAAFEAGQGSQPSIPFEILNLWYSCNGPVVMRWRSAQTPQIVTGIIAMEIEAGSTSAQPWLIKTVYSEFNSGAWLVNLGVWTPTNCSSTASSKRSLPMMM